MKARQIIIKNERNQLSARQLQNNTNNNEKKKSHDDGNGNDDNDDVVDYRKDNSDYNDDDDDDVDDDNNKQSKRMFFLRLILLLKKMRQQQHSFNTTFRYAYTFVGLSNQPTSQQIEEKSERPKPLIFFSKPRDNTHISLSLLHCRRYVFDAMIQVWIAILSPYLNAHTPHI